VHWNWKNSIILHVVSLIFNLFTRNASSAFL